jgi:aarF domain-containing kinase
MIPKGMFSRSKELLALAGQLAAKEVEKKIRSSGTEDLLKSRLDQARAMVNRLGKLKGAAMKAGQLLSIETRDLLPPEVTEILSQLQDKAPAVDFSEMEAVLNEELGADALQRFQTFNKVPIASASIGQVYAATRDGQKLAVKVQYPGVAESIPSDLKIFQRIAEGFILLSRKKMPLDGFFEELKRVLIQEVDYTREREFMSEYATLLKDDARFVVPTPVSDLSSRRVLTMSYEDGISVTEWMKTNPSEEIRTELAKAILDLYVLEFFEWGLVQTDANFGNFKIRPEEKKWVLFDFGATLRYPQDFVDKYRILLSRIPDGNEDELMALSVELGMLSNKEGAEVRALYVKMLLESIEPFIKQQPFLYSDEDYNDRIRATVQEFVRALEYSPPPKTILFLHRKLGGIYQLLRALEVRMDLSPYWAAMLRR